MSSELIDDIENNLNLLGVKTKKVLTKQLRELKVSEAKTLKNFIAEQKVSSLDTYNKLLRCKNVRIPSLNDDNHNTTFAKRRLQKELKFKLTSLHKRLLERINLFEREASIQGPPGTPYEGETFVLDLKFPARYPYLPSMVTL